MKVQTFTHRGSQINKIPFSEIEYDLQDKGFNTNELFCKMADENEFIYVSNGFLRGLNEDVNQDGEWHHYFKKDSDGDFYAEKLKFN